MSNIFGYCRVSTGDQNTSIQETAIKKEYAGALIRTEKASGTTRNGRPVLELLLDMLQQGDKLVVYKLDRLARNMNDLTNIVSKIESVGASLEILDQKIDTSTAAGKAFLQMLGVFAEFETNLRKERQLAGIEKAKANGVYKGTEKTIDRDEIARRLSSGETPAKISKTMKIGRASVYRIKNELALTSKT